ncbi:AMP-binding protein, partial [Peptostreptococcus porci]|uniref:AMP-binding protein n=1 Tax=Peptostreptococcus porci TaxID=2652282 RepID=UPI002A81CD43
MCLNDESFSQELLPELETMLFIGEVLPVPVAKELLDRFPRIKIINGYGPTEATVGISQVSINREHINANKSLPVGIPMPNSVIKIVNDEMEEVPKGEKGEIVIVGPSVSKGYYKNPEITNKSFYVEGESIFKEKSPASALDEKLRLRAYKTGDLGSIDDDGNIRFFGRKDFQIKLNGYRIEIEDIENNLRKINEISSAVVLPINKNGEVSHLKAIVVLKKGINESKLKKTVEIKRELSKLIPKYMVPRSFDFIDEMPLNTNGKIDRKKLYADIVEEA